mmetsp:Transcript_132119/g.229032  ORF Transcript_132119/g.229032 Transcript_132119/m.229032 type:complete len:202 (-) Transcript_132119:1732-2337(-)
MCLSVVRLMQCRANFRTSGEPLRHSPFSVFRSFWWEAPFWGMGPPALPRARKAKRRIAQSATQAADAVQLTTNAASCSTLLDTSEGRTSARVDRAPMMASIVSGVASSICRSMASTCSGATGNSSLATSVWANTPNCSLLVAAFTLETTCSLRVMASAMLGTAMGSTRLARHLKIFSSLSLASSNQSDRKLAVLSVSCAMW